MLLKIAIFCLMIVTFFGYISNAQTNEKDFYIKAYNYLNDSIVKAKHVNIDSFEVHCRRYLKGIKLKYDKELQIANRFIKIDHGFPIEDLARKKYNFTKNCLTALRIGSNECELVNQMLDSLALFWKDYQPKERDKISSILKDHISTKKYGYQVFFSNIYKNTLAAEIMSFCNAYDEGSWFGHSTSYYFVFDKIGEIKAIYSGITIHYN